MPQVEARKRHEYLEAAVSVLDGHLRYFKAGFEALKKLEPFMHQARAARRAANLDLMQESELFPTDPNWSSRGLASSRDSCSACAASHHSSAATSDAEMAQVR